MDCRLDNRGCAQIGLSCGIVAAAALHYMRAAGDRWYTAPERRVRAAASRETLDQAVSLAEKWAVGGNYPADASRFTSEREIERLCVALYNARHATRAAAGRARQRLNMFVYPKDMFLLKVAQDVCAAQPVKRFCFVNTSACDEPGRHWIAVVYSVQPAERVDEVIDLTAMDVEDVDYECWRQFVAD